MHVCLAEPSPVAASGWLEAQIAVGDGAGGVAFGLSATPLPPSAPLYEGGLGRHSLGGPARHAAYAPHGKSEWALHKYNLLDKAVTLSPIAIALAAVTVAAQGTATIHN